MFFSTIQKALKANGKSPLDGTWIPFKKYPRTQYAAALFDAAEKIDDEIPRGLFIIGNFLYPEFASSVIGKTIFGFAGNSFGAMCSLAPRAYAAASNIGRMEVNSVGSGHAHLSWSDIYNPIPHTVGIVQGAMDVANVYAKEILFDSNGPGHLELQFDYFPVTETENK